MSEPFLAEIRMFGFNFAPRGWAFCDGQLLQINQNQSLYSLLGTTYGGDGRMTFGLPDLRGRTPIHEDSSSGFGLGQQGGEETHLLTAQEIPSHTHVLQASTDNALSNSPAGAVYARAAIALYRAPDPNRDVDTNAVADVGDNQGHNNMQPSLAISFCIALTGLFPSRN